MSGQQDTIKVRCPECRTKYRVPVKWVGQKVRCAKCRAAFRIRVAEPTRHTIPTEDDVLGWLNEDMDEDRPAPRPRIVSGGLDDSTVEIVYQKKSNAQAAPPPTDNNESASLSPADKMEIRPKRSLADSHVIFRKTG